MMHASSGEWPHKRIGRFPFAVAKHFVADSRSNCNDPRSVVVLMNWAGLFRVHGLVRKVIHVLLGHLPPHRKL
jgi:hypothetical protein